MSGLTPLQERYFDVCRRVASAAVRSERRPQDVYLVAVTKYAEPEQIRELIGIGHRDFGENHVQQLIQRAASIDEFISRRRLIHSASGPTVPNARAVAEASARVGPVGGRVADGSPPESVRWHVIGHLQRNKVRKAIQVARLFHSVDSLRLAEEIQQTALRRSMDVDVLIQVNIAGEQGKSGCAVPAVVPLAEQIDSMANLRLRGLMTIAPYTEDPQTTRPVFRRCREIFEEVRTTGLGDGRFNLLSMGMSGDFEVALECGANIVRVGSAIFGKPPADAALEAQAGLADRIPVPGEDRCADGTDR